MTESPKASHILPLKRYAEIPACGFSKWQLHLPARTLEKYLELNFLVANEVLGERMKFGAPAPVHVPALLSNSSLRARLLRQKS